MTIIIKYIGSAIVLLFPILLLTCELIVNIKNIDSKITSLVTTNLSGLYPASLCLYYTLTDQKNMILEFIPFYFITITSGTYHLCDKINGESMFCVYDIDTLRKIDFSNSYLCVSAVILYLIKFEYISAQPKKLKYILNIFSFAIINLLCASDNYSSGPIFFILFEFICLVIIFHANYDNYYMLLDNNYTILYLMTGIGLEIMAYLAYICIVYNNYGLNNYWWIHSYFWHVPSLMGAMFLFEAATMSSVKRSFFVESYQIVTCSIQKMSYNYISLNEFGIEMMDKNVDEFEDTDEHVDDEKMILI
jgi:hypothetical protein